MHEEAEGRSEEVRTQRGMMIDWGLADLIDKTRRKQDSVKGRGRVETSGDFSHCFEFLIFIQIR